MLTLFSIIMAGCGKKSIEDFTFNEAYSAYISAFSSGKIPRTNSILVRLNRDVVSDETVNTVLQESPLTISPKVDGSYRWTDRRTIEFQPKDPLPSNTVYNATLALSELISDVPKELKTFEFPVQTMEQNISLVIDGVETVDEKQMVWQQLKGYANTADYEFPEKLESAFTAKQNGKSLKMIWTHEIEGTKHSFVVDSIQRGNDASEVVVAWQGSAVGAPGSEDRKVTIPALGDFSVVGYTVANEPEQVIKVKFSDPLNSRQTLTGLIKVEGVKARFAVQKNEIWVYPNTRQSGVKKMEVFAGIQNVLGHKLQTGAEYDVAFEQMKPEVRMVGAGTVVPKTNGKIPFAFEAVSLKSVEVSVMRIFETNILQFLQTNDLDGSYELYRVGKEIAKKTIDLTENGAMDLNQWNRHVIDISNLVEAEPGAIYRVTVDFGIENSNYTCEAGDQGEAVTAADEGDEEDEEDGDEEEEDYYYDYDYDWEEQWRNRDNPCHEAYYSYNERGRSRNILASDLGLIAKGGTDGTITLIATDLNTTEPKSGVELTLYDFQQQPLKTLTTDGNGIVSTKLEEPASFLVAKQGKQTGYLKLDDGYSLSLSKFDVGGAKFHEGIKGFMYGERGVWRPGDTIFLSFILEDKLNSLPEDHPVTFTLINPRGQQVAKLVKKQNLNGFYTFIASTKEDAPTGNYRATVEVGGATFEKNLKVETVMPNRLKINLDFGAEQISSTDENLKGKLSVRWLHGAIADGLDADVRVNLVSVPTKFAKFSEYTFDDPTRSYNPETFEVYNGTLDGDGEAQIPVELETENKAPGMMKATFMTRAFEPGGNFSADQFSLPYSPYSQYVGIKVPKGNGWGNMMATDRDHKVDLALVDEKGTPITGSSRVTVEFYKMEWRWWWDESSDYVSSYNSRFYKEKISSSEVTLTNGRGSWVLRVNEPDWGRYLIRVCDQSGHCAGKMIYIDYPYYSNRDKGEGPGGSTMLTFSADKEKYEVGETVKLQIPTGGQGRALISLETGSKVLETKWVPVTGDMTSYSFTATQEMSPNIYAHVTLIQPHSQTANDLPIRMYGIVPIEVTDKATVLSPKINMAAVLEPMRPATVQVSEATGKAMTYTVAVVDEGLLDLTRFATPDPWKYFYAREALDVKTWDIFDKVAGAYNFDVTKLLSIGGDGTIGNGDGTKQNRFRPVVHFMGPFELKAGETRSHTVQMPNYVGSVRTMVIAGQGNAYGSAERATPVRKPLMLLGTMPRVVGPDEEIVFPVNVFAMEDKVKDVTLTLETNDLFQVNGERTKSIRFSRPGDELVNFNLKVAPRIGKGTVKVTAKGGGETAVYNIDVTVRNPNPRITQTWEGTAEAGRTWSQNFAYRGMAGTNEGGLELSTIPPLNLGRRLNYLIQYPHGCIEQTTSSVFATLYLNDLMDLPQNRAEAVDRNIRAAISRLQNFQLSNGGMSYWPGSSEVSDWGTNYAGNFLIEAKNKGYKLPDGMLARWIKYQSAVANSWNKTVDYEVLTQADRLYLLAMAGSPQLGAMNRLRERSTLSNVARWRLAAAYKLAGQAETANIIAKNAGKDGPAYREMGGSYGSRLRDQALILECMAVMGDRSSGATMAKEISKALATNDWLSTQETGYALIAMGKFVGKGTDGKGGIKAAYRIGGGTWQEVTTEKAMAMIPLPVNAINMTVEVQNKGGNVLFTRVATSGIPVAGQEAAANNNLSIVVRYLDLEGRPIEVDGIEQGTDFVAEVKITNPGTQGELEEMALSQIFPSGWEIHNARMSGEQFAGGSSKPEYQDIRDDRVYTYFDMKNSLYGRNRNNWVQTYRIQLNAAYLGKFYLPTVSCEAMYNASVYARTQGQWVNVVKRNGGI